jgi:diguanylate cyclase
METVKSQIERQLHAALEQGQFRLYYQPQIEPRTGRIVGAEALLRWQDPAGELHAPDRFLQALETTGLIVPVGQWAFKQAAEDVQRWQRLGLPRLTVAFNVSPSQLALPAYTEAVIFSLAQLRGRCAVQVEIGARYLLVPTSGLMEALKRVRSSGVGIVVQDFGSDDQTHRRLWAMPVDALKIHRAFVGRMLVDVDIDDEVSGMMVLARAFRLGVIAEGVETPLQFERLARLHCEKSQGFLHGGPMSADRFEWMLRSECFARPGTAPRVGRAAFDA